MRSNPFEGYGVALITPFLANGDVDYDTLAHLVDYQIENGADFICALGTTAETPTLDDAEYQEILKLVIRQVNHRVPVMAGCSDNCTARLVRKLQSTDFTGASAVLSCVPAYNKPSQEGIYQHFMTMSEVSPLPVVLYNVPGRTGVNMTADTTLRLANASDRFIAIKEASGNVEQIKRLIDNAPEGFKVLSGDDSLAMDLIQSGASGVISVIGNAIPGTFGEMIHLIANRRINEACEIHKRLSPLYGLMFQEGNPSGVKAIMADLGLSANILRLPMTAVSKELNERIINAFKGITV